MGDERARNDVWMLDINSRIWKEVGRDFKLHLAS